MNTPMIRYILGQILKLQAVFLLLPSVTALIYHEKTLSSYLMVAGGCLLSGTWCAGFYRFPPGLECR